MKTLIFVRHGKSSWEHDLLDAERPLKPRAIHDAQKVINAFRQYFDRSTEIWSSYAVRASGTANIFKKELEVRDDKFTIKEELYTFKPENLLSVIASCEEDVEILMVFGHNPAITEVVNMVGDQAFYNIPTTGLVLIEFNTVTWKTLENGKILLSLFPKNL